MISIERLTKRYGNKTVYENFSLEIAEGERTCILGESGSGKTTLLNCIATMLRPTSGRIILTGQDISGFRGGSLADYRGRKIGYLFQEFELLDNLTARENILLPLCLHGVAAGKAQEALSSLAELLDIAPVLDKFPSQMSGGQKQRIGIMGHQ